MLSCKLANITVRLTHLARDRNGRLQLDRKLTDALLCNLGDLADRLGEYEQSSGAIAVGDRSLSAITQALAIAQATQKGVVVSLADRRTARKLRRDLSPDDGGSAA